ncbi:DUF2271 domain-containing protein [Roseimaritima ulvae]|uniref:DUF2271 domain-containing protein n=1 Tax=Roseimaritima ulvae TaxID=980254 RepID=A0A5B9R0Q6_9BACT|nr:DUF2271 domain-containing protein [Roseimaritima ulvae]QEG43820.1 hypothetical protein UC8_58770 [Roseimaritima ulvae]
MKKKSVCLGVLLACGLWQLNLGVGGGLHAAEPATQLEAKVEIPRLNVSEYHRPYVAMWIADQDRKVVANLAVWYQLTGSREGEGTKWLPDLRQWWRRSGRSLQMPVDGVSAATRPPGQHTVKLSSDDPRLAKLPPGKYDFVIEAAREVGGREMLQIPFTWPLDQPQTHAVEGKSELGKISITLTP